MKVKIFSELTPDVLEININNFLQKERMSLNQVQIKYSISTSAILDDDNRHKPYIFSALILYDKL